MAFSRCLLLGLLVAVLGRWQTSLAYSTFRDAIPNGHRVQHPCKTDTQWNGVGHLQEQGGGPRNAFGLAFKANAMKWNRTLCVMDSDGDGQTNGQELGDPDCVWTSGATPKRTTGITHPGFKTPAAQYPFSSTDKTTLDCSGAPVNCPAKSQSHVKTLDLTMAKGTRVPNKTTTYYCTSFEVPHDVAYHAIAFDAILDNLNVIHHMLLYGCASPNPEPTGECDMSASSCRDLIAVWSLGLPDQCMPDVAGVRFGNGTYSRFQLQVHWNNPKLVPTYTDESGMRIHYTPRLRQYDMGIMWLGQRTLLIPPGKQNTTFTGRCSSTCSKTIMPRPINVAASLTHMHLLGKQSRIRHTSDETNLTRDILFEEVYDYDSPKWTTHTPHLTVNPGDELQLVCSFDSRGRTTDTTYGDATNDEMCYGFLQYYPKSGDLQCTQEEETDLCYDSSTVCGTRCSLSILFDNVTALADQGIRECTASGAGKCNAGCRESVRAFAFMYIDNCLKTRHKIAYQNFVKATTPLLRQLKVLYATCSQLYPAYFNTGELHKHEFNTTAEVSVSCPSEDGITRFAPSVGEPVTVVVKQTPSSATSFAPVTLLVALSLITHMCKLF